MQCAARNRCSTKATTHQSQHACRVRACSHGSIRRLHCACAQPTVILMDGTQAAEPIGEMLRSLVEIMQSYSAGTYAAGLCAGAHSTASTYLPRAVDHPAQQYLDSRVRVPEYPGRVRVPEGTRLSCATACASAQSRFRCGSDRRLRCGYSSLRWIVPIDTGVRLALSGM